MTRRPAIAAVLVLATACSLSRSGGRRADAAPDLGLHVLAPTIVRWEPARARDVEFAIENLTRRTLTIPAPDPAYARVDVYAGPESIRLCGVSPRQGPAPRSDTVVLEPGDRAAVRVDLETACAGVPPGEYRYEVSYRLADTGRDGVVAGTLATTYGQLFVDAGSSEPPPRRVQARRGRPEAR